MLGVDRVLQIITLHQDLHMAIGMFYNFYIFSGLTEIVKKLVIKIDATYEEVKINGALLRSIGPMSTNNTQLIMDDIFPAPAETVDELRALDEQISTKPKSVVSLIPINLLSSTVVL